MRRNTIVVDGIPESSQENWAEEKEKGSLRSCRWITRPIVIQFLRFKDKMAVPERAKNLRGTNIFLIKDYLKAVRTTCKELIPVMKAARERGDIASICYDRLIVYPPPQKVGRSETA